MYFSPYTQYWLVTFSFKETGNILVRNILKRCWSEDKILNCIDHDKKSY